MTSKENLEELKAKMDDLYRKAVATQDAGYWRAYELSKSRYKEAKRNTKKRKVAA